MRLSSCCCWRRGSRRIGASVREWPTCWRLAIQVAK